jgi:glycosyltransferase involved in cell wall biosynthesis
MGRIIDDKFHKRGYDAEVHGGVAELHGEKQGKDLTQSDEESKGAKLHLKILIISPYHSGSHQAWAEGYRQYSQHEVNLLTLPGRFWKWRMHGSAVTLARLYRERYAANPPDVILATDMLDLSTFLALTRDLTHAIPAGLYMHENQLTYPLPATPGKGPMRRQKGERDYHYVFINYASMVTADFIFFNSHFHHRELMAALPNFLKHFPDFNELDSLNDIAAKSQVLPVGLDMARLQRPSDLTIDPDAPPLITWNQRWEYDKNPQLFFRALYQMEAEGLPFRLALCGERFSRQPDYFDEALARLSHRLIYVGFAEHDKYRKLLWESAVTISTAHHEFFGISILEAIYCHAFPILPNRLSYPELIPDEFHPKCLYEKRKGLERHLRRALTFPQKAAAIAAQLAAHIERYDWRQVALQYDARLQGCRVAE